MSEFTSKTNANGTISVAFAKEPKVPKPEKRVKVKMEFNNIPLEERFVPRKKQRRQEQTLKEQEKKELRRQQLNKKAAEKLEKKRKNSIKNEKNCNKIHIARIAA